MSPAKEDVPRSPQGVELLFPIDDGAMTESKKKDTKVEKTAKRQAALLKKLKAIEKGGDINAADKKGQTALMQAAAANNRLAVCWLVAKGADVTLKNTKGMHIRSLLCACMDEKKPLNEEQKQGVSYWVEDIDMLCKGTETDSVNEVLGRCEEYTYMGHHYSLSLVQRYAGNLTRGKNVSPPHTGKHRFSPTPRW